MDRFNVWVCTWVTNLSLTYLAATLLLRMFGGYDISIGTGFATGLLVLSLSLNVIDRLLHKEKYHDFGGIK